MVEKQKKYTQTKDKHMDKRGMCIYLHNICVCVCCVFVLCIYKYTHMHVYI